MNKKLITAIICGTIIVMTPSIAFTEELENKNNPNINCKIIDYWAKPEFEMANGENLVLDDLGYDYKENISRKDFCKLVINMIENSTGKKIDEYVKAMALENKDLNLTEFSDTNDSSVIALRKLGIIKGYEKNKFYPNNNLKRQDAAVILFKTARNMNMVLSSNLSNETFIDQNSISSYAKDAVKFVSTTNKSTKDKYIMEGTENQFFPKLNMTKQQAVVSILRFYKIIQNDFHELTEPTNELKIKMGYDAVKYYQSNGLIYILTYTGDKSDKMTKALEAAPSGGCSEVWTYDNNTKKLEKLFVKYKYGKNKELNSEISISLDGEIESIDDVDKNGNVYFTESWNEGMEHYGRRYLKFDKNTRNVYTLDYIEGRANMLTSSEIKNAREEIFSQELMDKFFKSSEMADENNGMSSFSCLVNDELYVVKYNLKDLKGNLYHEIGAYNIYSKSYTPKMKKILTEEDKDPSIFCQVYSNNNIKILDFCGQKNDYNSFREYLYNSEKNIVEFISGNADSGAYALYK